MEEIINKIPDNIRQSLWDLINEDDSKTNDQLFQSIAIYWIEKQQMFNKQIRTMK